MCLRPVPHSLKANQQLHSLSCPGRPCDNTVNNSNVWREGATGAATVGLSKWGQGLLTSGDVAPNPPRLLSTVRNERLRLSLLNWRSFLGFLTIISDVNVVEKKGEKKQRNLTELSRPERGLLSRLLGRRENTGVILEITLLKINVGLEECVIVP